LFVSSERLLLGGEPRFHSVTNQVGLGLSGTPGGGLQQASYLRRKPHGNTTVFHLFLSDTLSNMSDTFAAPGRRLDRVLAPTHESFLSSSV
jgi:hypothetical protein